MPAVRRHRRPDWARQLPVAPEVQGPSHAGLQQRYCPDAAGRARTLVERGYGALEPWLSAEPGPMSMRELFSAVARGSSGPDAAELWQQQQRQQQPPRAGRRRSVERIDWGDVEADQAA